MDYMNGDINMKENGYFMIWWYLKKDLEEIKIR